MAFGPFSVTVGIKTTNFETEPVDLNSDHTKTNAVVTMQKTIACIIAVEKKCFFQSMVRIKLAEKTGCMLLTVTQKLNLLIKLQSFKISEQWLTNAHVSDIFFQSVDERRQTACFPHWRYGLQR
jgi:hypothetical protein